MLIANPLVRKRRERKTMASTKLRSFVKGLVWETLSFLFILLVSYVITRSVDQTTKISVIYMVLKIPLYYMYERYWKTIRWGKYHIIESEL